MKILVWLGFVIWTGLAVYAGWKARDIGIEGVGNANSRRPDIAGVQLLAETLMAEPSVGPAADLVSLCHVFRGGFSGDDACKSLGQFSAAGTSAP